MTLFTGNTTLSRRRGRLPAVALAAALALGLGAGVLPGISAADDRSDRPLPIGDRDLPETRTTQRLAKGVTLTSIVRGNEPAASEDILTTTRGPWKIQVLTIDPEKARGHLAATYGPDLAGVEATSELARHSGALAAMNASFFTFSASVQYPGDPVGTGIYDGELLSEPEQAVPTEHTFSIDARSMKATVTKLHWSRTVVNQRTRRAAAVEFINHPPMIPADCGQLVDQSTCGADGDIVQFTPEFAASTPTGHGLEIVQDRRGCVVRVADTRGTALAAGQTSLQATGKDVVQLELAAGQGCTKTRQSLTDEDSRAFKLRPSTFAVNGRYRLLEDGDIVVPPLNDGFANRNPRSAAGTTQDGKIVLFTVDGRSVNSVGTTLMETAQVAKALGLRQAVNLDGGGSTTMVAKGKVVNTPSGTAERKVGDALIYVDSPFRARR